MICPRCKAANDGAASSCERCGFSFRETQAIGGADNATGGNLVGQVINGKYRVLSVLGEGGFGIVYKVELLLFDTGNIFALKLLHPSLSQDKSFRRRFLREAGLAMSLIHENTIQIREFGQTDDGHLFFTMDFCEGEPLKSFILREHYLTVNRALHITRQILSVLRLAHARGVIHRDIKPENIFLEKDVSGRDFVKVGDFGLAKSFLARDGSSGKVGRVRGENITRGGVVGTPRYMSPEQASGREDIDDRSDIYAVGVVLYEMLYGQVPPERKTASNDGSLNTPVSISGHPVPRAVWEIVCRAIEVDRDKRFQSSEEFLDALDALPHYTPTYMEPVPRRAGKLWKWGPVLAALLLVAGMGIVAGLLFEGAPWSRPADEPGLRALEPLPGGSTGGEGQAMEIPPPGPTDPAGVDSGKQRSPEEGSAGSAGRASMLASLPPGGISAFMNCSVGDVFRYQTYREGTVPDREMVYEVVEEASPGRFLVRVTPGERTFRWVIDTEENAFYQEFTLPDLETGEQTHEVRRLRLRLPPPGSVLEGDYLVEGLRVHARPVNLPLPRQMEYDLFKRCLCVESRDGNRIHCEYYQEGRGLVALVVYERRQNGSTGQGTSTSSDDDPRESLEREADRGFGGVPAKGTAGPEGSGSVEDVIVFARYLVGLDRTD